MTREAISRVVYWLDVFTGIANLVAYSLLTYGLYYTFFVDPNTAYMSDVIIGQLFGGDGKKLKYLGMIFGFMFFKVLFKYMCTTCMGVDFMMYELIQQRFYELFLEKGDETAIVLQEARANRLDAFTQILKDRGEMRKAARAKKIKEKKRKKKHDRKSHLSAQSSGDESGPESFGNMSDGDFNEFDESSGSRGSR